MERKAFLDQEAPAGYVAGVGRGATGFVTNADSGPVRFESNFGDEVEDGNDAQEVGILAESGNRSKEDDEADRIYEEIDLRISSRRKKTTENVASIEASKDIEIPTGAGSIRREFTSLKSELAQVSMNEWENLPEVGDLTRRNKRQRLLDQQHQRTYAAPDILISGSGSNLSDANATTASIIDVDNATKLAEIEDWEQKSAMSGDLEKGRLILASLRKAEPYKADSWVSSARLEEQAKQISQARSLIIKGCDLVPHDDDIWLESIRLHRSEGTKVCKGIMSEALRLNPRSEKLWFAALDLENPGDENSRKKVVMKALEFLPTSLALWKALVDMDATDDDKIRLLTRATELCPGEWDLWLTLVNRSDYSDAKSVLNKARKQLPAEPRVWITALKLEERENLEVSLEKLTVMLTKGRKELMKHAAQLKVEHWIDDAVKAENEGFSKTAQAIVKCVSADFDPVDIEEGLRSLADEYSSKNATVASYVYELIAEHRPASVNNWVMLFKMLKSDIPRLFRSYERAIESNTTEELFPLMYAKDKWLLGSDIPAARKILEISGNNIPNSEMTWVAQIKLEVRTSDFERALDVSKKALGHLQDVSPRLWLKRIHILRYCQSVPIHEVSKALILKSSDQALESFPEYDKLYLQRSQILADFGDLVAARECLSIGTKMCPDSVIVWSSLASLDIALSAGARARSVLDTAVSRHPNASRLWEAKINLEFELKDFVTARQLINKGLKQFPSSPGIWILHLKNIPKMSHRKNAFLDALKQTNNSTEVLLAIGVFFLLDAKYPKARAWFERALNSDNTNGDAWGWMYCFLKKYGTEAEAKALVEKYTHGFDDIHKGGVWNSLAKLPVNLGTSPVRLLELVSDKLTQTNF